MVAAVVEIEHGVFRHVALSVGSCSAVAQRLHALEQRLIGQAANSQTIGGVSASDLAVLSPIDDVRGSARYRTDAALTLLRRVIAEAIHE